MRPLWTDSDIHFCQNLKFENHSKAKRNMWELQRFTEKDSVIGRNSNTLENYSKQEKEKLV